MYDTILFDLDGTLTDSGLGITNAAMYGLEKMGWKLPPREELYQFIGPPLFDTYRLRYGMSEQQAQRAVEHFRVYYGEKGMLENQVYSGIPEALERLRQAGKRLILATSKPEKYAKIIMAHFGLDRYVTQIAGATMDPSRSQKGQVIAYALREFAVDPAGAIMVGDRKHDILGARENGLPAVGVTYGYGSRAELETAGAAAVADTPAQMADYLLEGRL